MNRNIRKIHWHLLGTTSCFGLMVGSIVSVFIPEDNLRNGSSIFRIVYLLFSIGPSVICAALFMYFIMYVILLAIGIDFDANEPAEVQIEEEIEEAMM